MGICIMDVKNGSEVKVIMSETETYTGEIIHNYGSSFHMISEEKGEVIIPAMEAKCVQIIKEG